MSSSPSVSAGSRAQFAATRWSVVLAAARTPSPMAQEALEALCRAYWQPLFAYVCRQGVSATEAEDLTQGFFLRLLQKRFLADVHPSKGRFRCFLLAALKHFLANEWDRVRAQKRGGGVSFISLDGETDGQRLAESVGAPDPDETFDREWALAVLDQALRKLKEDYINAGKADQFEKLKRFLAGGTGMGDYGSVASELAMAPGAVAVAVHRMRREYGRALRAAVSRTVTCAAETDDEMRYLFRVIRRDEAAGRSLL